MVPSACCTSTAVCVRGRPRRRACQGPDASRPGPERSDGHSGRRPCGAVPRCARRRVRAPRQVTGPYRSARHQLPALRESHVAGVPPDSQPGRPGPTRTYGLCRAVCEVSRRAGRRQAVTRSRSCRTRPCWVGRMAPASVRPSSAILDREADRRCRGPLPDTRQRVPMRAHLPRPVNHRLRSARKILQATS
jgi:hypothetical protein